MSEQFNSRAGYRGYIASRPIRGITTPQQLQNLLIRDFAAKKKLKFLLSATEYAMPSCYMMLDSVLEELDSIEGIICFSMYMLPKRSERRRRIYQRIIQAGAKLYGAEEGIVLESESDIPLWEDLIKVEQTLSLQPLLR